MFPKPYLTETCSPLVVKFHHCSSRPFTQWAPSTHCNLNFSAKPQINNVTISSKVTIFFQNVYERTCLRTNADCLINLQVKVHQEMRGPDPTKSREIRLCSSATWSKRRYSLYWQFNCTIEQACTCRASTSFFICIVLCLFWWMDKSLPVFYRYNTELYNASNHCCPPLEDLHTWLAMSKEGFRH